MQFHRENKDGRTSNACGAQTLYDQQYPDTLTKEERAMATADAFRLRATECEEDAELARNEIWKRHLHLIAKGWRTVSESQAWLDGDVMPTDKAG